MVLIVSGGHTMLVHVPHMLQHEVMGQTLDDAAGEAFDKVARLMGLGFPGGPALDAMSGAGDPHAIRFPRAMEDSGDYDFSMSGLKTAVLRYVKQERAAGDDLHLPDIAASFQEAIVDVQVSKTMAAAKDVGAPTVCSVAVWWPTPACVSGWPGRAQRPGSGSSPRRCRCVPTTPRWWPAWALPAGRRGTERRSTPPPTRS